MSFDRPYEGIRVVDVSQGVAGPYCAMLLAQHGADVIKVEPLDGDWARLLGPSYGDHTAFSVVANLGKRCIAVDLKSEAGRGIVDRMIPQADVFLEGFRPGVIERLGFSHERLGAINPGLIYVSISGFGQEGSLRDKPAMDPVLQAFTGFMAENKSADGIPLRTPTILFDMSTALYVQQAVAAALFARRDDPRGRRINASLMEGAANLQAVRLMSAYRDGPYRLTGAPTGTFRTSDGWLQIITIRDHEFRGLCQAMRLEHLAGDERFSHNRGRSEHADHLNACVAEILPTQSSEHWRSLLTEAGVQNEVVQTYSEFVDHPHTEATGLISRLVQPGSDEPWTVPNPPGLPRLEPDTPQALSPRKGQHTSQILDGLGYTQAEIDDLAAKGVVGL